MIQRQIRGQIARTHLISELYPTYYRNNEIRFPASYYQEAREKLESPKFTVGANDEIRWYLRAYPKGDREESEGHVSVFLVLASCSQSAVRAKYSLAILDTEGEKKRAQGPQLAQRFKQVRARPQGHVIPFLAF